MREGEFIHGLQWRGRRCDSPPLFLKRDNSRLQQVASARYGSVRTSGTYSGLDALGVQRREGLANSNFPLSDLRHQIATRTILFHSETKQLCAIGSVQDRAQLIRGSGIAFENEGMADHKDAGYV